MSSNRSESNNIPAVKRVVMSFLKKKGYDLTIPKGAPNPKFEDVVGLVKNELKNQWSINISDRGMQKDSPMNPLGNHYAVSEDGKEIRVGFDYTNITTGITWKCKAVYTWNPGSNDWDVKFTYNHKDIGETIEKDGIGEGIGTQMREFKESILQTDSNVTIRRSSKQNRW